MVRFLNICRGKIIVDRLESKKSFGTIDLWGHNMMAKLG